MDAESQGSREHPTFSLRPERPVISFCQQWVSQIEVSLVSQTTQTPANAQGFLTSACKFMCVLEEWVWALIKSQPACAGLGGTFANLFCSVSSVFAPGTLSWNNGKTDITDFLKETETHITYVPLHLKPQRCFSYDPGAEKQHCHNLSSSYLLLRHNQEDPATRSSP